MGLLEWNDLNSWCKEWILDDIIEFDDNGIEWWKDRWDDCEYIMSVMRNNVMISHNNDEMMSIFLYKSLIWKI